MNTEGKFWLLAELEKSQAEPQCKAEAGQAAGHAHCCREEFRQQELPQHILISNFEGKRSPNIFCSIFQKFWCPSGITDTLRIL